MKKRVFYIKSYVNMEKEKTTLIKDIEKDEYTLEIGRQDANKEAFSYFKEQEQKLLDKIKQEHQNENIEIRFL